MKKKRQKGTEDELTAERESERKRGEGESCYTAEVYGQLQASR